MKIITSDEVRKIITSGTKQLADKQWKLPKDCDVKEKINEFIKSRGPFKYEKNYHDCDNCALELMAFFSGYGWPIGMVFIEGHCLNLYINNDKELIYIEPLDGVVVDQDLDIRHVWMV